MAEATAFFWIATRTLSNKGPALFFCGVLSFGLCVRAFAFPTLMYQDHVTAMLAALTLPLVFFALGAAGSWPLKGAFGLAGYLGHPHPMLRRHAAWALGAVGTAACAEILRAAGEGETDPEVGAEIAAALGEGSSVPPPTLAG